MATLERIPFVDLHAQHEPLREEILATVANIVDRSSFIGGDPVTRFEQSFASYLGVKEAIGVGNGTDALWLALVAVGVKPGDMVITVPNTFIATVEAITRAGAQPVFVDIDLETALMSVNALERYIENECVFIRNDYLVDKSTGSRIAAVLPVHLYGLPVDIVAISELCNRYHLPLVEDACQAHGAEYLINGSWQRAGTVGAAAAFSFYPGKNLGAFGDAGAVVTNDPRLADHMRELRNHGSSEKYIHTTHLGWNARLDAIQAAVLSIKLRYLDEWNSKRREAASWYGEMLSGLPLDLPVEPAGFKHNYHLYVVRTEERERLRKALHELGIETGIHYPIPLHLQQAYAWMGKPAGSYPNAELSARTILSLPMHPVLTCEQVTAVSRACGEILAVNLHD